MARWRRDDRLLRPLPSPNWPCGVERGGPSIRLQAAPGQACVRDRGAALQTVLLVIVNAELLYLFI
jgi:hypothetical protein